MVKVQVNTSAHIRMLTRMEASKRILYYRYLLLPQVNSSAFIRTDPFIISLTWPLKYVSNDSKTNFFVQKNWDYENLFEKQN